MEVPGIGTVSAQQHFDIQLPDRRVCLYCMRALEDVQERCSGNTDHCEIRVSPRRVRGWLGVQRYLHESEFGIDLVRNGRVIESASRDLFHWTDGDTTEVEYPIDDPRNRGRFVGAIHLDHCRVNYTKDRFERSDPAWAEMVEIVRGKGPLRPNIARSRDFPPNHSPLYKLFQAFRRSSPQGKKGTWARVLVVRDNDLARDMASRFERRDPEYLSDDAWWKLVEEQDSSLPNSSSRQGEQQAAEQGTRQAKADSRPDPPPPPATTADAPRRRPVHLLSRKYVHPTLRAEYEVQAFEVEAADHGIPPGAPWVLSLADVSTRSYEFLYSPEHPCFRSTSMWPLDALLLEIAVRVLEHVREQGGEANLATVLSDLRGSYRTDTYVSPEEAIAKAEETLVQLRRAIVEQVPEGGGSAEFAALPNADRSALSMRMSLAGLIDHERQLKEGRFWEHADGDMIRRYFKRHPERFLNGAYWADPLEAHSPGGPGDQEVQSDAVDRYDRFLRDAAWLAGQSAEALKNLPQSELDRALRSIELLIPDKEV